jgi:type IV fimbrial biogenesis protein FimT
MRCRRDPKERACLADRQRGVTRVELMIKLTDLSIVSANPAPSFRQMIATQRVRSAESALNESLWIARSEAIKRNADVGFSFASVGNGWSVQVGGDVLHVQDGLPSVTSGAGNFVFNAYGRMKTRDGTPLQIEVADAGVSRCIEVTSTGRSNAEDGTC